ncbi:hypothetical protein AMTR_s00029p00051540 [Amborella trichopoda]|uniref:Pentatricopeptide repeat-containing protein n=1 Tax=Amborella trichopoda TaxID=13333 RepID=W1PNV6_AMBTC|nr:hypothetical protein AMTR_s00029p00051540 [Amborella trichopoda]
MTTGPLIARKLPPILSLLDSCTHMNQLKQIHAHIIIQGLSRSNFTGSRLIAFCAVSPYASIDHAKLIFAQIQEPSIFTWNSMIRGLSMSSNPKEAIVFYSQLLCKNTQPNNFTFPFVIKACTEAAAVETGLLLHNHVIKLGLELDAYVLSSLIHMYASGGKIDAAIKLFAEASEEEVWEIF